MTPKGHPVPIEPLPTCDKCGQTRGPGNDPLCGICRRAADAAAHALKNGEAVTPKKRTRRPVGMSSLTARIRRMLMRLPAKQRRLALQVLDAEFDQNGNAVDLFTETSPGAP